MPRDCWPRSAGEAEPSVVQLMDPLMGAVVVNGNPTEQLTKQHQVLISENVKKEIDKIIPEFRDSFMR